MATASSPDERSPATGIEPTSTSPVARELLVLLAEQRPQFLHFVRKRVRSGADAEDLLQQALLKATEKLNTVRSGERLEPWFYRVLRNTVADHHAQWARTKAKLEIVLRDASEAPPEEAALCGCSLGLLPKLKPEYAEMLRRVDIADESIEDVATALHLSANNAKVRLHRGRVAVRNALLELCGTNSVKSCQDCACDGD